jgi:uncharacterized protein (TIGR00288 family)
MEEERIGLFLDFENLAIGVRDQVGGGATFDFKPIADALAERGRVVVRRAYAEWAMFDDARRDLVRHHIELIEIPQGMGVVRKNAADIKMAVDALELSFERDYITTFVLCTGDSDFTPLVDKLRERNKRVIGIGVEEATSSLLPPACDEFLFYERLPGVDLPAKAKKGRSRRKDDNGRSRSRTSDVEALGVLVTQTLSGLKTGSSDVVLGSTLKRTLLRKDSTFDEGDYGFRTFGELLKNLASRGVLSLSEGSAPGDPEVDLPEGVGEAEAFKLLSEVVSKLGTANLTGLKNELRKKMPDFSEKRFGYRGFLQFCKAAQANGHVELEWDEPNDDYVVRAGEKAETPAKAKPAKRKTPRRRSGAQK